MIAVLYCEELEKQRSRDVEHVPPARWDVASLSSSDLNARAGSARRGGRTASALTIPEASTGPAFGRGAGRTHRLAAWRQVGTGEFNGSWGFLSHSGVKGLWIQPHFPPRNVYGSTLCKFYVI